MTLSRENLDDLISSTEKRMNFSSGMQYVYMFSSHIFFGYVLASSIHDNPLDLPAVIAVASTLVGGSTIALYTGARAQKKLEQALSIRLQ